MNRERLNYFAAYFLVFAASVDYVKVTAKGIHDVKYSLNEGERHVRQINYAGDKLIVGSKYEEVFGEEHNSYRCVASANFANQLFTDKISDTKVMKHYVTNPRADLLDYFVQVTREVWECHDDKDQQSPKFMRIVNVIKSYKQISDLQFYDGIRVQRDGFLGNEKHVFITEIKYYKEDETGRLLQIRYDGLMTLDNSAPYFYPNSYIFLINVPTIRDSPSVDGTTEIKNTALGFTTYPLSDQGKILRIGSRPPPQQPAFCQGVVKDPKKPNGISYDMYECVEHNIPSPLPPQYRTEVFEELRDSFHADSIYFAGLNDEDFSKIFTIIGTRMYICTYNLFGKFGRFFRVQNEIVGRSHIKAIHASDGIKIMLSLKLPDGGRTVRFRDVKYMDTETLAPITFKCRLEFRSHPLSPPNNYYLLAGEIIDTKYTLQLSGTISRTLINTKGYDLRIGSNNYGHYSRDPDKSIVNYDIVYKCGKSSKSMKSFDTIFKVKVNEDDEFHAIHKVEGKETQAEYFKLLRRDVLFCKRKNGRNEGLYRVVNILEVLVPVREIETYDGVEIVQTNSNNNRRSVKIVEKKYFNIWGRLIQVATKMELSGPDVSLEGWANRVQKTMYDSVEELFPKFDRYPIFDYYAHPIANLEVEIGGGPYVMRFAPTTEPIVVGDADDIADCKLMENHQKVFYPMYSILVFTELEGYKPVAGYEAKDDKDSSAYNRYFQDIKIEIWDCTIRKTATDETKPPLRTYQFLRIVSNLRLKQRKDLPYKIGKIFYSAENRVAIEMENGNDVVKITELKHLNLKNNYERLSFPGMFLYERKPRSGVWKSGTVTMPNNFRGNMIKSIDRESKKIDYDLSKTISNAVSLNNHGVSLQIDSKSSTTFGNKELTLSCDPIPNENFKESIEVYQTKVKMTTMDGEGDDQNVFKEYFETQKLEVWKCQQNARKAIIYRVVHNFLLKRHKYVDIRLLLFFDGTKVMYGYTDKDNPVVADVEIAVLKYIQAYPKWISNVKFEGKVQFSSGNTEEIKAVKLKTFGVNDLIYSHVIESHRTVEMLDPENIMRRTIISDKGLSLEIGSKYEIDIGKDTSPKLYTEDTRPKEILEKIIFPRVVINNLNRLDMKKEFLLQHFTYTFDVWSCQDSANAPPIIRVVNKLVKLANVKIGRIYHHEGVYVNVEKEISIEEIKYMQEIPIYSTHYQPIKINGFIRFEKDPEQQQGTTQRKEIDYKLDTEYTHFQAIGQLGFTIEIPSKCLKVVDAAEDDVVTCEKHKKHIYNERYAPNILIGLNLDKLTDLKKQNAYFVDVNQRFWTCRRNQKVIFNRVVNELIALTGSITSVYYGEGIEVGTLIFPDNTYTTMIREVKYIDPTDSKVVKYDGAVEIIIEMNSPIDRWYDGIPEVREEKLEITHPNDIAKKRNEKVYWPLNTLKVYGRRFEINSEVTAPAYDSKGVRRLNGLRKPGGYRVIQYGQFWEEKYERKIKSADFRCIMDMYNPPFQNALQDFVPKVMEYSSDKIYLMDYEERRKEYDFPKSNLIICYNEDEHLFRVDTRVPVHTSGITAVFYTDNVKMPNDIKEDYFNAIDQEYYIESVPKTFKYDKEMPYIDRTSKPQETEPKWYDKVTDFVARTLTTSYDKARMLGRGRR